MNGGPWRAPAPEDLAALLVAGPPSVLELVDALHTEGGYAAFKALVRQYLPAHEWEVLGAQRRGADREMARLEAFTRLFEREYFPIHEAWEYPDLTSTIPFVRLAWSSEQYHDVTDSPGRLMLRALCEHPDDAGGVHLTVLDALARHVPAELLGRIPAGGLSRETLHARLDGTRYAAAARFADWLWQDTDCAFLDISYESGVPDDEWEPGVVEWGKHEWARAMELLGPIEELECWLGAGPAPRLEQLLDAALPQPGGAAS